MRDPALAHVDVGLRRLGMHDHALGLGAPRRRPRQALARPGVSVGVGPQDGALALVRIGVPLYMQIRRTIQIAGAREADRVRPSPGRPWPPRRPNAARLIFASSFVGGSSRCNDQPFSSLSARLRSRRRRSWPRARSRRPRVVGLVALGPVAPPA